MTANDIAATSIEEARLIAQIGQNMDSHEAYENYATWLDTFDSTTAVYVRAYTQYAFNMAVAPSPISTRTTAWHRMLGAQIGDGEDTWHEILTEAADETSYMTRAAMNEWIRPVICMYPVECTIDKMPIGGSRFIGSPDLPIDFNWPICDLGPLTFQAQINFTELKNTVAAQRYGLPTDGWLLLFAFDDYNEGIQPGVVDRDENGKYVEIPNLTYLAYVPSTTKLIRRQPPTGATPWKGAELSCSLIFKEFLDLPWAEDTDDERLKDVTDWIGDLRPNIMSKLMGYPIHGRTDNTSPGPDWLNILTLGSHDETGWCWCDGQHLDVYVQEKGFKDGSFSPSYGYAS